MPMELVFVIGMAVLLILCIKVKANAFISLLATALVMGMLSGMSGADTVSAITSGFSGTVKVSASSLFLASCWATIWTRPKQTTGWPMMR